MSAKVMCRDFPLRIPSYEEDPEKPGMPSHLTLSQARSPQVFYPNQCYLGFIPVIDVFEGPIFARFQGTRPTMAEKIIQQPDGTFIFDQDLADSWLRVEYALTIIAHFFYNPLRPLTAPTPSYPSNTKFYEPKNSLKRALDSVMYAQKLFLFLIAELRHNIAISRHVDTTKTTWVDVLKNSHLGPKIDNEWLADLAASKALTTVHLAGYLIDPTGVAEALLERFRRYHQNFAPVYVIFASINRTNPFYYEFTPKLMQNHLQKLGFALFNLDEAMSYIKEVETYSQNLYISREILPRYQEVPSLSPLHHSSSPYIPSPKYVPHPNDTLTSPESPFPPIDQEDLPESCPGSQQAHGQRWWQYLREQRSYYQRGLEMEIENEDLRRDREIQEHYSSYYNALEVLPAGFTAFVYAWKPTPLHPEYLLRTPLEMCEVFSYWSRYPASHRIFDIFRSVWDLYDPSCDLDTYTRKTVTTSVEDVEPTALDAGVDRTHQPDLNISMPDLHDDRRKGAKFIAKARLRKSRDNQFHFEDPVQYARHRYGLIIGPKPFSFNHESKLKWWLYLGKNLQEEKFDHMDTLTNALECLMSGHSSHVKNLYDIYLRSKEMITDNRVFIERFPHAIFRSLEGETQRNLYILRFPHTKDNDWVIGVNSAANVVLALRVNWASHRNNVVRNFLKYGIEFLTLRRLEKRDEGQPITLTVQYRIPLAPQDDRYTLSDYENYEKEIEQFFDSPSGSIAGRSGGTVARLWRKNARRFNERLDIVNKGPTEQAKADGVKVHCGPDVFYDDYLSTPMDAFICGQYLARSSMSSYPQYHIFSNS